jgi:hypothetical protein
MNRAALAVIVVVAAVASSAGAASAPAISLLSPADGATVVSSAATRPTFSWRLDFPEPQQGRIIWEIAADRSFSKDAETLSQFCETDVNCWTSVTPQEVWSPPRGHVWYWRVGFTSATGTTVYSATWSFSALSSTGADRTAPRVQVLAGSARRGTRAGVVARVADDRLFVRVLVTLVRSGRVRFGERFSVANSRWTRPVTFRMRSPLPRALPGGRYAACVTATDRAGNHARSCARYVVR